MENFGTTQQISVGQTGFTASRPALELTQHHNRFILLVLSLGVKWPGREADHSPPPSTKVNDICTPIYIFMAWYLVKKRKFLHGVDLS
jgi:hypothetical protein